jgi:flagellar export protein FliJ
MAQPFRLASVLSLREARLVAAMQELARTESLVRAQEATLERLRAEVQETLQRTTPAAGAAADLQLASDYLAALERQELALIHQLDQLRARLERTRTVVRERHRGGPVHRRRRAPLGAAPRQEESRAEQRATDEIAGLQAEARRRTEGLA